MASAKISPTDSSSFVLTAELSAYHVNKESFATAQLVEW